MSHTQLAFSLTIERFMYSSTPEHFTYNNFISMLLLAFYSLILDCALLQNVIYTLMLVHSAVFENRLRIPLVTFPGPNS